MSTQAWPFLISRNKKLDYRTLVAPPFLIDKPGLVELKQAVSQLEDGPSKITYRKVHIPQVGELSLYFRKVEARQHHIGEPGNDIVLEDDDGRQIYLIEGIVVQGSIPNLVVTDDTLQMVHKQVEPAYRAFWSTATRSLFEVKASQSIEDTISRLPQRRFRWFPPSIRAISFITAVIVLLIAAIGAWGLYNHLNSLNTPTVNTPATTLTTFCNTLTKDHQTAYRQLSNQVQSHLPEADFADFFSPPNSASCTSSLSNQSSNIQTATLSITYNGTHYTLPITLSQEGKKGWKINENIVEELGSAATLTTSCNALLEKDYPTAYSQLSSQIQNTLTETAFMDFFSPDHIVTGCAFTLLNESGNTQAATLSLTYQDGSQHNPNITLSQDGQRGWKINENIVQELQMPSPTPTPRPALFRSSLTLWDPFSLNNELLKGFTLCQ